MPSRLLREGILDSRAVNALGFPAEVFYRRLMSVVDDFGRFDGRPEVLRCRLYPLKVDTVREADISRWIAECEKAGLIALYAVDGAGSPRWIATREKAGLAVSEDLKPYILFRKLGSPRAKDSKFPAPPAGAGPPAADAHPFTSVNGCAQPQTDENGCAQPQTDVPGSDSGTGSDSGAGTTTGAGRSAVGRDRDFDPLKHEAEQHRLFVERWNAAGLPAVTRLTASLKGLLAVRLRDPEWADQYPAALARAGESPHLRAGEDRRNGPLDPHEFLTQDALVGRILAGKFDRYAPGARQPPAGGKAADRFARLEAEKKAREGGGG